MKKTLPSLITIFFTICCFWLPLSVQAETVVVEVANIAALKQLPQDATIYHLTGEVVLTFQQNFRKQKFIEDATGGILIDDNGGLITSTYNVYDGITGLKGTFMTFGGMLQFVPTEDPGAATSQNNVIVPPVITLEQYIDDFMEYQSRLVTIQNVSFVPPTGTFTNGLSHDFTDGEFVGKHRATLYDVDYIGTPKPTGNFNITGLPNSRADGNYLTARNWADIESLTSFELSFNVIDEAGDPITDAVMTFKGDAYAPGEYLVEAAPEGTHSYSFYKAGFNVYKGQVIITDQDVVVDIMLIAEDPNMISTFPWNEDFASFPPLGWTRYSAEGAGQWIENTGTAYHNISGVAADSWLVSPQIHVPLIESGDQPMLLSFMERNQFMGDYGYSGVMISTGSGIPGNDHFVQIYESKNNLASLTEKLLSLSAYAGKEIYIAFVYQGQNAHRWFIDDVKIDEAPGVIDVTDLATLYTFTPGTGQLYRVTGELIVTHQHLPYRGQIFLQDNTRAIMVDDASPAKITTAYDLYDGITGITGTLVAFQNMLQLVPSEDPGAASSKANAVTPLEMTLSQLTVDHQGMLVMVRNVEFTTEHLKWVHNQSFTIKDDSGTGEIRTPNSDGLLDYFGDDIPTTPKDIIGIVSQRYEVTRLMPRTRADMTDPYGTSVPQLEQASFRMYPNPVREVLTIESNGHIGMLRIFDMSGRKVLEQSVENNTATIQTSMLNKGIYLVQMDVEGRLVSKKLQVYR